MNLIDFIIVIILIFGFFIGFKRGFTKQLVCLGGTLVSLILAFIFKNPISVFLYNNLPFFNFGGILKGVTVLNILLYEVIAFFIVFSILMVIIRILMYLTTIFEKVLTMTIILGIPSKILGGVLGIIQNVIIVFIFIYILSLPMFNVKMVSESKISNIIIDKTPIMSTVINKSVSTFEELNKLKTDYKSLSGTDFNQEALNLLIKNKIITKDNAIKLINSGKLKGVVVED